MLELKTQQVDIWSLEYTDNLYEKLKNHKNILSYLESFNAKSFKYKYLQKKYILFHILLRIVLSKYLSILPISILFEYNEYGKPFIHSIPLQFNLSHSKNQLLIGISKSELGVDIEFIDDNYPVDIVGENILHANEKVFLAKSSNKKSFFKLWTKKESLLKATGTGLNKNIKQLDLSLNKKVF